MNESTRTFTFVGVAVASVAAAWFVHASSQPEEPEAFAKVGTVFYPEFTDPTLAGSLQIVDFDEQAAKVRQFTVEFKNGRWRIPTHHGYPADAEDRLEQAAASLIGVTRTSLAGRRANAHERFGVLDPLGEDSSQMDGLGQRIIIKDKNGNVLADYILGKRVAGQENLYFVRTPGEDETYRAEIDLDVSTKFADWVEQDLLKLDRTDLLSMELKTLKIEEVQTPVGPREAVVGEDSLKIHREETGAGTKWKFDGLNPETEEINTTGVSSIQTALDGLELKGVRPKPQGLTPTLQVDLDQFPTNLDPNAYFAEMRAELMSRGFMLAMPRQDAEEESYRLFGDGGELVAQSAEGLVYHLHFGKAFTGTESEIEVGKTEVADEEGQEVAEADDQEETDDTGTTRNRYLFIRVEFDESLLGEAPVKPEEPPKPAGLKEEAAQAKAGEKEDAEKKDAGDKAENKEGESSEAKADDEQAKLKSDYEAKKRLYEADLNRYAQDKQKHDEKVKAGQAKATELNNRFGEWYYVVSGTSYDDLIFTRADIVKDKEKETEEPAETGSTPEAPPFQTPGAAGTSPEPAVAEKPAVPAQAAKPETTPEPK